jgi:hypothetical protein
MGYLTPLQDEMNDRLINGTDYGKYKILFMIFLETCHLELV